MDNAQLPVVGHDISFSQQQKYEESHVMGAIKVLGCSHSSVCKVSPNAR